MISQRVLTTVLLPSLMLAVLVMASVMASPSVASEQSRPPSIRVSGEGELAIAPDIAEIRMSVVRESKTARAALNANNDAMAKVFAAMQAQGIADRDLQTSNFNISPRYYHPPRGENQPQLPPKIIAYVVSNTLSVRIRDLESVGKVLDQAVSLGVNSGGNIRFMNDKPKTALKQARRAAMEDAIDKANTLAAAAGVALGDILEISESSHSPRPTPMARAQFATEAMMADAVPIARGENTYRVTVNVSWEIDQ